MCLKCLDIWKCESLLREQVANKAFLCDKPTHHTWSGMTTEWETKFWKKNSTIKHKITFYNVFISWYMYTFMLFVILGCMYESKRSRKKPQTVGVISSANLKIDHLLYSGSFRTITVHVCCCAISWLLWKSENKVFPVTYLCCLLLIHNLYPLQKHYLWENEAIKKSYFTQNTEMFW